MVHNSTTHFEVEVVKVGGNDEQYHNLKNWLQPDAALQFCCTFNLAPPKALETISTESNSSDLPHRGGESGGAPLVKTDADLDVPDRAKVLLDRLDEDGGGPWTTADAHTVAHDSDDENIHIGKRAIRKYLKALADEGVFDREAGDHAAAPDEYRLVRFKR